MHAFIHGIPKAELHIHIEGSLEPELMFDIAERNGLRLPFSSVSHVRRAYSFTELQSFLDIYYQGSKSTSARWTRWRPVSARDDRLARPRFTFCKKF